MQLLVNNTKCRSCTPGQHAKPSTSFIQAEMSRRSLLQNESYIRTETLAPNWVGGSPTQCPLPSESCGLFTWRVKSSSPVPTCSRTGSPGGTAAHPCPLRPYFICVWMAHHRTPGTSRACSACRGAFETGAVGLSLLLHLLSWKP